MRRSGSMGHTRATPSLFAWRRVVLTLVLTVALAMPSPARAASGDITTYAGGGAGDGGPATAASLAVPFGVAIDGAGNLYIADTGNHRVRKVGPSGTITTVAGNGHEAYGGDGGPATAASLNSPYGVAIDGAGNLYIADTHNHRVRKVSLDGTITTVAGTGQNAYGGDGGPATDGSFAFPSAVEVDSAGNLYIADLSNNRIRKVTADGKISTVAGNGQDAYSGDGRRATLAALSGPQDVAIDGAGNLYIADEGNSRIRKVTADGTISTVAGNGQHAYGGDGGPATSASIGSPRGVDVDSAGHLYIADGFYGRVRKVIAGLTIITVAGNGEYTYSGDGGPAAHAALNGPAAVAVNGLDLYIADAGNHRIRKVVADALITTVAGSGLAFSGDGSPATNAALYAPRGLATDAAGNLFIADTNNHRVRKVSADGTITTVAGNGQYAYSGDGGLATAASLAAPYAVDVDGAGNLYIADTVNLRIRKVTADGTITTVAGNGQYAYSGDGGPATAASLRGPAGIEVDGAGNLYIADTGNHRIRKVTADGTITTVAGNGQSTFSGDNGPATAASIRQSDDVEIDGAGNIYIADTGNHRIRKVSLDGTITTVAGNGQIRYSGDGGPATAASVWFPRGIEVDGIGHLYIADTNNHRIRKVTA